MGRNLSWILLRFPHFCLICTPFSRPFSPILVTFLAFFRVASRYSGSALPESRSGPGSGPGAALVHPGARKRAQEAPRGAQEIARGASSAPTVPQNYQKQPKSSQGALQSRQDSGQEPAKRRPARPKSPEDRRQGRQKRPKSVFFAGLLQVLRISFCFKI